ncbi:hypothetical protein [Mucilaginibacter sp.]|uniref:hypothetical protein n=1 Tax=Mucilaginibacter sp. TaxID=1882438 RepID=UPI0025F460F5|nr:hypothetical protein [Mucilaginibacter sp.]
MEALFALFMIVIAVITIRGFIKTQEDKKLYRLRVQKMTVNELRMELINFNSQVRHMPGVVRRNSSDGFILTKVKAKAKIVNTELKNRGLR